MSLGTPRQLNDLTIKPQMLEALKKKAADPWQSYPMVGLTVGGTKVQWLATLQAFASATIPHKGYEMQPDQAGTAFLTGSVNCICPQHQPATFH